MFMSLRNAKLFFYVETPQTAEIRCLQYKLFRVISPKTVSYGKWKETVINDKTS